MTTRAMIACTAALLTSMLGASNERAAAAIPGEDNPDALTQTQVRRRVLAFNQRTLVGAYKDVGRRDPSWDDLVVRLLEAWAHKFTNSASQTTVQSRVAPAAPLTERLELGRKLTAAGCNDPLVLYCRFVDKSQVQGFEDLDMIRRAARGLAASEYPAYRKLAAAKRYWRNLRDADDADTAEMTEARRAMVEHVIPLLSDAAVKPDEQILAAENVIQVLTNVPPDEAQVLAKRIRKADVTHRWAKWMALGAYHRDRAWDERGRRWAHQVEADQWRGFRANLLEAQHCLTRAWKMDPNKPEAPAEMISVAMGLDNGQERVWFERATKAQFDYIDAYHNMIWSLWPRWGGDLEQMHAFGLECLNTGRFDTLVPYFYKKSLDDIAEAADSHVYWQRDGVYDNIARMCEGYLQREKSAHSPNEWRTWQAGAAWWCTKFDAGREILEQLGDDVAPAMFKGLSLDPSLAPSTIFAYGDPQLRLMLYNAERVRLNRNPTGRVSILRRALDSVDASSRARPYLRAELRTADWAKAFETGEWVSIQPKEDLAGWQQVAGDWRVTDEGRLVGASTVESSEWKPPGLELRCRQAFGYRFEIRGEGAFWDTPYYRRFNLGVLLNSREHKRYTHVLFYDDESDIRLGQSQWHYHEQRFEGSFDNRVRFRVQQWDRWVRVYVNGKLIVKAYKAPRTLPGRVVPFAVGAACWYKGDVIWFSDLQVRRLERQPNWAGAR